MYWGWGWRVSPPLYEFACVTERNAVRAHVMGEGAVAKSGWSQQLSRWGGGMGGAVPRGVGADSAQAVLRGVGGHTRSGSPSGADQP